MKRENKMNKNNKNVREFEVEIRRMFSMAKCSVKIIEDIAKNTCVVIIGEPNVKDCYGVSTTNFFEKFATLIKQKYLKDIKHESISWYDYMKWKSPAMKNKVVGVRMDYTGSTYQNPTWGGLYIG